MNVSLKTRLALMCLAIAAGLSVGCRAPKASDFKPSKLFSMKSSWPWGDADEPQEGTPVRVVGTWSDTVLTQAGQKPQRGFGGRLVFYEKDNDKPILVDGQLVVYAFDESGRDPTDNKPTRRYVFPPDQVPRHMSTSEIGASYSFWLPWDEAGGPRTEVSLICRFEPKGGGVITSEQTRHLLPGALTPHSTTAAGQLPRLPEGVPSRPARLTLESLLNARQPEGGAQLASFESPAGASAEANQAKVETTSLVPERRMSVTSIRLPKNYQLPAAANEAVSKPASVGGVTALPQPQTVQPTPAAGGTQSVVVNPAAGASPRQPAGAAWQTAPAKPPRTPGGFGTRHLARPQLVTPQFMSLQPTPAPAGVTTTVSYPERAAPPQVASPQPAVR
jgi:hypothetical protein